MMIILALLLGCANEDAEVLQSWEGIYKTQRLSLAEASCEEGPDIETEPPFFEIETAVGKDAHLVAIRRCESQTVCEGVSWFEGVVVAPGEKKLEGDVGEFAFGGPEGGCLVQWMGLTFTRDSAGSNQLAVEIEVHADDAAVNSEAECLDILQAAPEDGDCDQFYVLEGKGVR